MPSPKEKARTYSKIMLTKVSNKLAALVQKDEAASIEELESVMEDFDKKNFSIMTKNNVMPL